MRNTRVVWACCFWALKLGSLQFSYMFNLSEMKIAELFFPCKASEVTGYVQWNNRPHHIYPQSGFVFSSDGRDQVIPRVIHLLNAYKLTDTKRFLFFTSSTPFFTTSDMSGSQNAPQQSARNSASNSTTPELAACKQTLFAYTNCTLLKRRKKKNNNRVANTPLSDFLL